MASDLGTSPVLNFEEFLLDQENASGRDFQTGTRRLTDRFQMVRSCESTYSDCFLGFEGSLKTTRRQQMKTPVNARIAGTRPKRTQIACMNHPKRPKCKSESQASAKLVNRSSGSKANRKLNA